MIVPNVRMSGLDAQKRYRIKDLTAVKTNEPCALHGKVIQRKNLDGGRNCIEKSIEK